MADHEAVGEEEKTGVDFGGDEKVDEKEEAKIKIDRSDASWLLENGTRLRKLEEIAGAKVTIEECGQAHLCDAGPGGLEWAERCLRAACAMHNGATFQIESRLQCATEEDGWNPPITVMEIPKDATGYILGKGGSRLAQLSEDMGVVTVVVEEEEEEAPADAEAEKEEETGIKVGDLMEAPFGKKGRWFEVEIVEVADGRVKAKWTYDDDQPLADLAIDELRPKEDAEEKPKKRAKTEETLKVEVGAQVEAKFSNGRWFDARITKLEQGSAWVKWDYDENEPETEVKLENIKGKPKLAVDKFHIYGPERGRMTVELRMLCLVENKVPGHVSSKPKENSTVDGLAWGVVPLLNDGELKAKVIGKGGSVRMKISKLCGSELEYLGNTVYIVGSLEERKRTEAVLELLQTAKMSTIDAVPEALNDICSRVRMPAEASPVVVGKSRATMNALEDEHGVITFWGPTEEKEEEKPEKETPKLKEGMTVEGKFAHPKKGDLWFEAIVLEVKDEGKTVKVKWTYDESEESELPESDIRIPGEAEKENEPDKTLYIFGPERQRKFVELRSMSIVETKCPGTFGSGMSITTSGEGDLAVTSLKLSDEQATRCPEQKRKAIAAASSCTIEQIGDHLYFAGTETERNRAEAFVQLQLMEKPSIPADIEAREEADEISVPQEKVDNLADWSIERIEEDAKVFTVFEKCTEGPSRVLVCSHDAARRAQAVAELTELRDSQQKPKKSWGEWAEKSWNSKSERSSSAADGDTKPKKKRVYVVDKAEEERRAKRAARFG